MRVRSPLALLFALLITLGSSLPAFARAEPATPVAASGHGIQRVDMDSTVEPAADFYRFANGGWLDRTQIPADRSSFGVFDELSLLTRDQLLSLLAGAAQDATLDPTSDMGKAVRLFTQGVDVDARNTDGMAPIQPILDRIDTLADLDALHAFWGPGQFLGVADLVNLVVIPDFADSSVHSVYLQGPLLGLPDVSYYLADPANADVQQAYRTASVELLVLTGVERPAAMSAVDAYYAFEQRLAALMVTDEEAQDMSVIYNPTPIADLQATYPLLDWDAYLTELGLAGTETIINSEVRLFAQLADIVRDTSLATLKDYLRLKLLWNAAGVLGEDAQEATFGYMAAVTGVEQQAPTEEEVLDLLNGIMGDAVGQLYVVTYFPPAAKDAVTSLVADILAAFRARLGANPWMTAETRAKAIAKLDAMGVKVGYPDEWKSYAGVEIGGSFAESALSAINAEKRRNLAEAGEPVDRGAWDMPAQTVNAYYNPFNNEIVFPAAILQAPFFDPAADLAVNYGGIGYVIGHEITHGFDLQGSQFDAKGNFVNWWSDQDLAGFQALNDRVAALYDGIEVIPGVAVNGQLTVTENVADLGGIQVAHDALQLALEGAPASAIDGFSPDQRFFISAATVWREEIRGELLATLVQSDPHAPSRLRATIPLQCMAAFYDAFAIAPGDPMYLAPEDRIVIW